jgi:hypothetical protein
MIDQFLSAAEQLIVSRQQSDLFGGTDLESKATTLCVNFLKEKGYSVRKPAECPIDVKKLDDLTSFFYDELKKLYPDYLLPSPNEQKDRAIAKNLINRRMEIDGLSYRGALKQCMLIIYTVLNSKDAFNFDGPPDFSIFGQAGCRWITTKAIKIINRNKIEREEFELRGLSDKYTEEIELLYPNIGYSLEEFEDMEEGIIDGEEKS